MLTPQKIMDQLEELIRAEFPGEDVHQDLVPSGFTRPCTLVELTGCDGLLTVSTGGVEMRPRFTITTFVEVDEYHHSHLAKLHERQMRLVALLIPGFIRVDGRAAKVVDPAKLGGGFDFDTVEVTLAYHLSRRDFIPTAQVPLMEHLQLETEVRTYE